MRMYAATAMALPMKAPALIIPAHHAQSTTVNSVGKARPRTVFLASRLRYTGACTVARWLAVLERAHDRRRPADDREQEGADDGRPDRVLHQVGLEHRATDANHDREEAERCDDEVSAVFEQRLAGVRERERRRDEDKHGGGCERSKGDARHRELGTIGETDVLLHGLPPRVVDSLEAVESL